MGKKNRNRFIQSDSKEGIEIPYYIWYGIEKKSISIEEINKFSRIELLSIL